MTQKTKSKKTSSSKNFKNSQTPSVSQENSRTSFDYTPIQKAYIRKELILRRFSTLLSLALSSEVSDEYRDKLFTDAEALADNICNGLLYNFGKGSVEGGTECVRTPSE